MREQDASVSAIEVVYRSRGDAFFRLALARTGDAERARDALHEGFARAIRNRSSFAGRGSLEAWIARCVINAAHDARQAEETVLDDDRFGDDARLAERLIARQAISELPQRQRDVLFLRHYLDLTYHEIADALEVEVGTVSATLHAARRALLNSLQEAV